MVRTPSRTRITGAKAIGIAMQQAGLSKRVTSHAFRRSFATHLPAGCTTSAPFRNCLATVTSVRR